MKPKNIVTPLIIVVLFLLGCNVGQVISTATPNPTQTPTTAPYTPVPRWMIISQPYFDIEILGENWNYINDRWGESYGCIDYERETGTSMKFEQCFSLVYDETDTFDSQHNLFLGDGFEELTPQTTFDNIDQIALLGKRLTGDPDNIIEFFEIVGVKNYITLVELYIKIDDPSSLQDIYEKQVAAIMDYVLRDSLQKSRLIPRPTATPMSPPQKSTYDLLAANLITESEASALYGSTWEAIVDYVSPKEDQRVCRKFEDRTNADVLWVSFVNCIYPVKNASFDEIVDAFNEPGDVLLESNHKYDDKFVLYGYNEGHTFFYGILLHEEYVYTISLESRTLSGQAVKDIFTNGVDDFIYRVLMINTSR